MLTAGSTIIFSKPTPECPTSIMRFSMFPNVPNDFNGRRDREQARLCKVEVKICRIGKDNSNSR